MGTSFRPWLLRQKATDTVRGLSAYRRVDPDCIHPIWVFGFLSHRSTVWSSAVMHGIFRTDWPWDCVAIEVGMCATRRLCPDACHSIVCSWWVKWSGLSNFCFLFWSVWMTQRSDNVVRSDSWLSLTWGTLRFWKHCALSTGELLCQSQQFRGGHCTFALETSKLRLQGNKADQQWSHQRKSKPWEMPLTRTNQRPSDSYLEKWVWLCQLFTRFWTSTSKFPDVLPPGYHTHWQTTRKGPGWQLADASLDASQGLQPFWIASSPATSPGCSDMTPWPRDRAANGWNLVSVDRKRLSARGQCSRQCLWSSGTHKGSWWGDSSHKDMESMLRTTWLSCVIWGCASGGDNISSGYTTTGSFTTITRQPIDPSLSEDSFSETTPISWNIPLIPLILCRAISGSLTESSARSGEFTSMMLTSSKEGWMQFLDQFRNGSLAGLSNATGNASASASRKEDPILKDRTVWHNVWPLFVHFLMLFSTRINLVSRMDWPVDFWGQRLKWPWIHVVENKNFIVQNLHCSPYITIRERKVKKSAPEKVNLDRPACMQTNLVVWTGVVRFNLDLRVTTQARDVSIHFKSLLTLTVRMMMTWNYF